MYNRRTAETGAAGTSVARTIYTYYDAASNVTSVINGRTVGTSYAYDPFNERISEIDDTNQKDGLRRTLTTVYDAGGNVVASADGLAYGNTTHYTYDALNRQVSVTTADGSLTTTSYDQVGNVTAITDPLNHTTTYTYDVLNRKVTMRDADGGLTTYSYDAADNLTSLTDPDSNTTTWVYDAVGRKIMQVDPTGYVKIFAYDAAGRMTSSTDENTNIVTYSYDFLNRRTEEMATSLTQTYAYDANDNLVGYRVVGAGTFTTMSYDPLDRLSVLQDGNRAICNLA